MNDPIVEEVRRIKEELAARFNYDLKAIYEHLKQREIDREEKTGRKFVSAPSREADSRPAAPAGAELGSADTKLPEDAVADPFVDEVRKYRDAHAARFNYDLKAIYEDIKEREKEWEKKLGRKFVSYAEDPVEPPPKPAAAPLSANATLPEGSPAPEH